MGRAHRDLANRYSSVMPLVRGALVTASPSLVLPFLAWLVESVRRPRRVWWEWTGEGWREIE